MPSSVNGTEPSAKSLPASSRMEWRVSKCTGVSVGKFCCDASNAGCSFSIYLPPLSKECMMPRFSINHQLAYESHYFKTAITCPNREKLVTKQATMPFKAKKTANDNVFCFFLKIGL